MASNSTASIPALASSLPSWLFPSQLTPVEYSCKGLPLPNVFDGTMEVIQTPEFWLRCGISGVVATFLYVVWGFMVASRFPRTVSTFTPQHFPLPHACTDARTQEDGHLPPPLDTNPLNPLPPPPPPPPHPG